jgi:hypothetical protein
MQCSNLYHMYTLLITFSPNMLLINNYVTLLSALPFDNFYYYELGKVT